MSVASIVFVRVLVVPVRGPATLWDTPLTCELHGCTSHSPGRSVTRAATGDMHDHVAWSCTSPVAARVTVHPGA